MPVTLRVERVVSQPFEEVTYVAHVEGQNDCLVVDPGFEPEKLQTALERLELRVVAILVTHGHVDHIAGIGPLKERFPEAPIIIGSGDARMLIDPFANLSALGGVSVTSPPADLLVHDGQSLEVLGLSWQVREIPGHSPGHVVYIWHDGAPPLVFGGDVLFAGGIGRYDFPGGDGQQLVTGIREKLYTLSGDTIVFPGHGPPTSIADELRSNPFTREGSLLWE